MTAPGTSEFGNGTGAPRVLIATAREWLSGARLALALHSFGCEVSLLSPADHPARLTGVISQWTHFWQMRPFRSFEHALDATAPDSLILADEIVLHYGLLLAGKDNDYGLRLRHLIESTTAGSTALRLARTRFDLLHQARQLQVPVPETEPIPTLEDLPRAAAHLGFPLVLKSDGSAGGQGVRIARSMEEAQDFWDKLHRTPSLPRVLKRGLIDGEWMHLRSWTRRVKSAVSAQQWIAGREATSMAMTHQGRLLASVEFEVVQATESRGPSSVLRVLDDVRLRHAMARIVAHLGINGFCGFDFICEPGTGNPLLIEMNTRPTQVSHLSFGKGKDLVAAYVREVLGKQVEDRPAATNNPFIALFPQELRRDAASSWVRDAWMDVPWDSPALIDFALEAGGKKLSSSLLPARGDT